ncbi:MAG: hypothetical protein P8Z75_01150 [Gammaproteobacteria bacterium]|jgi:hypothetical protein
MKNAKRNWMLVLGLAGTLALPGLAMADGWRHAPQKFAGQHYQQRHDWHGHHRDHRDHYARHRDRDRHEWREHRRYHRYDRDAYRRHEWREHARYYGRPIYPRAYWSGWLAFPSVGLILNVH